MSDEPSNEGNGATIRWRLARTEREVDALWEKKASAADVTEIKAEVRGLRQVLIVTALSWVAGSTMFLLAVLQLTQ